MSTLIALGVGGLTTGRLAGVVTTLDGALHGVVMWGITMMLGFWLMVNGAGFLLGNVFSVLGETVSAVAAADWGATGAWWILLILLISAGAAAGGSAATARN